ncbi:MAG: tryptophan 7-halogenase [Chthoniobacterales bacterium]|jgi:FADH2-dependent halogenase|nr:tryptophan 7-halogenase [Chthoniobacterales bacterium]
MKKRQVIILGGGPAGSTTALHLLQAGIQPLIIERHAFPRYHIGESLSGECRGAIRDLGLESEMLAQDYPVKHGVNVFNPHGVPFWVEVKRRCPETNVLIPTSTWSVTRSTYDNVLLEAARQRGAEYMECEAISPIQEGDRITGLQIRTDGGVLENLHCDVLVDCSGQATFLASRGFTGRKVKGGYANQIAVYSQLADVVRDSGTEPSKVPGNTLIFYKAKNHWAWMIPVSETETSLGVVTSAAYFKEKRLDKAEFLRTELLNLNPDLTRRITNTDFLDEVRTNTSYSYSANDYTGKGFLCVGDAHEFTDPIFSFGVFLSMREGEFAAQAIGKYLGADSRSNGNPFADYEMINRQGQDAVRDLIDCFWEYPLVFTRMASGVNQDDITDLFAGRLYGHIVENNKSRQSMRRLMTARRAENAPPPRTEAMQAGAFAESLAAPSLSR